MWCGCKQGRADPFMCKTFGEKCKAARVKRLVVVGILVAVIVIGCKKR